LFILQKLLSLAETGRDRTPLSRFHAHIFSLVSIIFIFRMNSSTGMVFSLHNKGEKRMWKKNAASWYRIEKQV